MICSKPRRRFTFNVRLENLRHNTMRTHYLSKDPVSIALTRDVTSLDGKTVLVTDADDQFIMRVLVVPDPGDDPKVCWVSLQEALVCTTDSWYPVDCIPPVERGQAAYEYLTAEGLALLKPSQGTLLFGATLSFSLPDI